MRPDPHTDRPGAQASWDSKTLPFPEIVAWLRENLGVRLVAYIGGVQRTSPVTAWAEGREEPDETVQLRLRNAFHAAAIMVEAEGRVTTGTWFMGMNPHLGDVAPARALREWDPISGGLEVVKAARYGAWVG